MGKLTDKAKKIRGKTFFNPKSKMFFIPKNKSELSLINAMSQIMSDAED